jgi:hypothetical protein
LPKEGVWRYFSFHGKPSEEALSHESHRAQRAFYARRLGTATVWNEGAPNQHMVGNAAPSHSTVGFVRRVGDWLLK